jgi:hypothetical protein
MNDSTSRIRIRGLSVRESCEELFRSERLRDLLEEFGLWTAVWTGFPVADELRRAQAKDASRPPRTRNRKRRTPPRLARLVASRGSRPATCRTTMIWKSVRGCIARLVDSQARRAFIDESRVWTALWTGYPVYPPHAIDAASEHPEATRELWSPPAEALPRRGRRDRPCEPQGRQVVPTAGAAAAAEHVSTEML